jgi:nucleoid-associated protein YgaU
MSKKNFIRRIEVQIGIILGVTMFSVLGVLLAVRKGEKGDTETTQLVSEFAETSEKIALKDAEQGQARLPDGQASGGPVEEKLVAQQSKGVTEEKAVSGKESPPKSTQITVPPSAQEPTPRPEEKPQSMKGKMVVEGKGPETTPSDTGGTEETTQTIVEGEMDQTVIASLDKETESLTEVPPAPPAEIPSLAEEQPDVLTVLPSTAPKTSLPATHTVQANDTLISLARKYYGDDAKWTVIYEANRLSNQNFLKVGQKLTIPNLKQVKGEKRVVKVSISKPRSSSPGRAHRVQKGDTLYNLARMYYGDENKWERIYNANEDLFSEKVTPQPGDILIIP